MLRTYPSVTLPAMKLGATLRAARKAEGLSQPALADEIGLDKETIVRIEHDANVTVDTIEKVAARLRLRLTLIPKAGPVPTFGKDDDLIELLDTARELAVSMKIAREEPKPATLSQMHDDETSDISTPANAGGADVRPKFPAPPRVLLGPADAREADRMFVQSRHEQARKGVPTSARRKRHHRKHS